jgi:predicted nucleic acid-binding protein
LAISAFRQFLSRHRIVALDTSVFIYQVEPNPKYIHLTQALFVWLEKGGNAAVTSTISMSELLVPGYKEGDRKRVDNFYALLTIYPQLTWFPANLQVADRAALFRAEHRLKTPDALQAATAVECGANGFVTNDPVFKRVAQFETLVLDEVL